MHCSLIMYGVQNGKWLMLCSNGSFENLGPWIRSEINTSPGTSGLKKFLSLKISKPRFQFPQFEDFKA